MIKMNEYFDGNVKSLGANNSQGNATVGVIAPGEFAFGTATVEIMNIVWGELKAQIPGEDWKTYQKGESFRVEKGVTFKVTATEAVAYVCQYL